MNHSRTIGALLLTAGFLFGSYQVVAHVTRVDWVPYGLAAGLMIAGMVLVRIGLEQARPAAQATLYCSPAS